MNIPIILHNKDIGAIASLYNDNPFFWAYMSNQFHASTSSWAMKSQKPSTDEAKKTEQGDLSQTTCALTWNYNEISVTNTLKRAGHLPDGMKAACCWNCMLARACWYGNMPALNIVVAPLAFSSAGLFGKGGKTGGSPWWGDNARKRGGSERNQRTVAVIFRGEKDKDIH